MNFSKMQLISIKTLKLITIFTILLLSPRLTVHSQTTSRCDTLKCFTYQEARIIISDLQSIPIKDSIIAVHERQITNLSSQVELYNTQDSIKQSVIVSKKAEIVQLTTSIDKCQKRGKVKTIIFTSLGTIVGFIISAILP